VLPDAPASPRYHCGFQGLQRGWADVYPESLDCQWLDITDLAGGDYTLRIVLNPRRNIPESNYDNNTVEIPVTLTPPGSDSPLDPCAIQVLGLSRECGWRLSPADTAVACTPGATVVAGCGCSAGGECQGDTILRACAGGAVCSSADALASNDDVCGFCSQLSFRCPAQGAITVMTASYASDIDSVCQVAYQEIVDPSLPEPVADAGAPEIGG